MDIASRRGFLVVTATTAMAISTLMQYSLSAIGPYVTRDLALSSAVFGSFFTVYFAVCALGSVLLAGPSQRLGPQWGMAMVGIASALGFIAIALAPTVGIVYLGLFFSGIAGALSNPATNLTLMSVTNRGVAIGVKQSGVQVSAVLGGLLVAPIAGWLGWRGALLACAVVASALLIPALQADTGPGRVTSGEQMMTHTASILGLAIFAFLMGSGLATTIAYLPVYAHQGLEFSTEVSGLLLGVFGTCAVVGRIAWGYVSARSSWFAKPPVALGTMAMGASAAAVMLWTAGIGLPYVVFPGAVVMGLTGAAWNGLVMAFVIDSAPTASSGRSTGRVQAAFFGGLCLTPLLFGYLIDHSGTFGYAWVGTGAIYVIAFVISQTLVHRHKAPLPTSAGSYHSRS